MSLQDLGFTAEQERLYRSLLEHPDVDRDELAALTGLNPDAVARGIDELIELGVAKAGSASPTGLAMANPAMVIGQLIERREDDLMRQHRRVSDTRSELATLAASYVAAPKPSSDNHGVERLDDLAEIRERLEELSFFTRTSVYSVQPGGPQSKESLDASRPLDLRGLRRNIDMRIVHESSVLDDEINRAYLREIVMLGAHVRVADQQLERMVIMDEEVAVVPVDPANSRRGALIVRHPGLLAGFLDLFGRIWQDAAELPWQADPAATQEPAAEEITDQDKQVLGLLASGCTDETAAREVGVSVRHLRRRISRLMQELGATSRFEAGAEAARRGWL